MPDIFIPDDNITNTQYTNSFTDTKAANDKEIFYAPTQKPINPEHISANTIDDAQSINKKSHTGTAPGLFAAFMRNPQRLGFVHQDKDEKILIFIRRHFATNLPWIIITIVALFLPLLFTIAWQMQATLQLSLPTPLALILLIFYYLAIFGYAFFSYLDWFFNIGIVTQKRIMDIDFIHLSYIDVAITQLPEVEDVVHTQRGFFASYFNYGDIVAHTVAGKEDFVFEKIPDPSSVVDIMSKLIAD
jgi:hypothetical protein